MWILRIILIVVGIACLLGLYWYMRRHPPRREPEAEVHIEPGWAPPQVESNASLPAVAMDTGTTDGRVVHGDSASRNEEIISLSVTFPEDGVATATVLRLLVRLGCEPGKDGIYHFTGADSCGLYSVANLFEPGVLDPHPEDQRLRGLVFFFAAKPGGNATSVLDRMLGAVHETAVALDGKIRDAGQRPLTAARELELKLAAAHYG